MYLVKFSIFWRLFGHFWISLTRLWVPRCPKMNSPVQGEYFWYRGRENRPTRKKDRSVWKPVFKSNLTPQSSWSREMTFHFLSLSKKKKLIREYVKFFNRKKWPKIFRKCLRHFWVLKRLKKKLGHFLVQKDWKKSWVTF